MKKSALAAVAAAAIGIDAYAITAQLYLNADLVTACPGASTPLTITGTSSVSMNGDICLTPPITSPYQFKLSFAVSGPYSPGSGTTFDKGTIDIYLDVGTGWGYFSTINVTSIDPLPCLANQTGHLGGPPNLNVTTGLDPTAPLPGLWYGGSTGADNAVCIIPFFGYQLGLYLN